jgi:hypothetical protein
MAAAIVIQKRDFCLLQFVESVEGGYAQAPREELPGSLWAEGDGFTPTGVMLPVE